MNSYFEFAKLRFKEKIQYRTTAIAGLVTQFAWGFLQIILFTTLMNGNDSKEITMGNLPTFIWLQQALFSLTNIFREDGTIYNDIISGNIVFDMSRPLNIFSIWFYKNLGLRIANGILKGIPVILITLFLSPGFKLNLPHNVTYFILFLISLLFTIIISILLSMFQYAVALRTINFSGIKQFYGLLIDTLQGSFIPLFFYPTNIRKVLEILPTGNTYYLTNRFYYGDFPLNEAIYRLAFQGLQCIILYFFIRYIIERNVRKIIVQGG